MTTSAKPLPDPTVRFLRSLSILLQEYADQVEARAGTWPPSQSNGVSTPITPIVRGHRQRQIVELPGMCTTGGMRNQEIADAIDYDESNVWNTMTTLQGSGIVEQVPVPGPQRWRLTAPYRQEFRGAGEFLKAVPTAPAKQRPFLDRAAEWATRLEARGLAELTTSRGEVTELHVSIPGERSPLVTVNVPSSIWLFGGMFSKRAPRAEARVRELIGQQLTGRLTVQKEKRTDELLDALTAAYEEAAMGRTGAE